MITQSPLRRSRRLTRAVAAIAAVSALGGVSIGLLAAPASAGVLSTVAGILPSCAARPTTTPFAPWGDTSSYFLMPGGSFEAGTPDWTTGAATVVSGNETSFVNAKSDTHSLAIPSGATVTSPTVCV